VGLRLACEMLEWRDGGQLLGESTACCCHRPDIEIEREGIEGWVGDFTDVSCHPTMWRACAHLSLDAARIRMRDVRHEEDNGTSAGAGNVKLDLMVYETRGDGMEEHIDQLHD
jgi:hypothetical protein